MQRRLFDLCKSGLTPDQIRKKFMENERTLAGTNIGSTDWETFYKKNTRPMDRSILRFDPQLSLRLFWRASRFMVIMTFV